MTQSDFTAFYPQFAGFTPAVVLTTFIAQANSRFSSFTEPDAEEARRLYTAHRLTMYSRTALPGDRYTYAQLAAAGQAQQKIASKKVGEVAVTYASGTSSSAFGSTDLADLTETDYGIQLLSLIRLYSRSIYVP